MGLPVLNVLRLCVLCGGFHVEQVVQTMNPWAMVKSTDYSTVEVGEVLGINQGRQGEDQPHSYTQESQEAGLTD